MRRSAKGAPESRSRAAKWSSTELRDRADRAASYDGVAVMGVERLQRSGGRTSLSSYRFCVRARDKLFSLLVSGAFADFGRRSVLQLPIRLSGEGRIAVGSNVFVGAGSWLQVLDDPVEDVALTIGDGTSIAGNCVLSA